VDLPGYGYAKISKNNRKNITNIVEQYLKLRIECTMLFLLIDIRLPPQAIDLDFVNLLGKEGIPFDILFTKIDKVSQLKKQKIVQQWQNILRLTWSTLPNMFLTSAIDMCGRDDILTRIASIIES